MSYVNIQTISQTVSRAKDDKNKRKATRTHAGALAFTSTVGRRGQTGGRAHVHNSENLVRNGGSINCFWNIVLLYRLDPDPDLVLIG